MKYIRLLAVALSFTLAGTGSIYGMDKEGDKKEEVEHKGSGDHHDGDSDSGGSGDSKKKFFSSSADQVSLLEWVENKDKAFGGWFGETRFGHGCFFGTTLVALYAAHPHATKVVVAATFVYGVYRLYKRHNRRKKEREQWADED